MFDFTSKFSQPDALHHNLRLKDVKHFLEIIDACLPLTKKHNHQQGDDLVAGWLSIADPAALLRFDAEVTAKTAETVERRQRTTDVAWALKKKDPGHVEIFV